MTGLTDGCFVGGEPPNGGDDDGCCVDVGFWAERFYTNQVIVTGVETKIDCDFKQWDPGNDFSLANDWFLVPLEGRYVFTASLDLLVAAAGSCEIRLYHNAVKRTDESNHPPFAKTTKLGCSCVLWCQVGDTVDFRVHQITGFASTLVSCNNQFTGALIFDNS